MDEKLLEGFSPDERKFIESLEANGQLLVTSNERVKLPPGVTHILVVKPGKQPELKRVRFH